MKRLSLLLFYLLLVLSLKAEFRVISKSGTVLTVEFNLGHYELQDHEDFVHLYIPDANYPDLSGAPSLPNLEFKIGVPEAGDASYRILSSNVKDIRLDKPLKPVPHIESGEKGSVYRYIADTGLYRPTQEPLLKSLGLHKFRDKGFIPFIVNPADYDAEKGLKLTTHALFEIQILGNTDAKSPPAAEDAMTELLLDQLLNGEDARNWKHQYRQNIHFADFSRSPWWMRIETDKKGIYRINQSHLSAFPTAEIDPRSIRLFSTTGMPIGFSPQEAGNEFREVPIRVVGEEDGSFDAQDYIVFYGGNRDGWEHNASITFSGNLADPKALYHNPYSQNYVYWLTFAGDFAGPPLRIENQESGSHINFELDSHRHFVHLETESQRRIVPGLTWYMSRLFGSSTMDYHFDIDLPDLLPDSENKVILRLRQEDVKSQLTHRINVLVNNVVIENSPNNPLFTWYSTNRFDFSRASSALVAGTNRITIRVLRNNTIDNLFLDYIRVEYRRKLIKGNEQYMVNGSPLGVVKYKFSGSSTDVQIYRVNDDFNVHSLPFTPESDGFSFSAKAPINSRFWLCSPAQMYSPVLMQKMEPNDISVINQAIHTLIVSPALFLEKAQELADFYKESWGYHAHIVKLDDIFDQFNGGHPDPAAIRQYVKYLYHKAPEPKLQTLTLLGLGTLDWRNYSQAAAAKNHIPVYYKNTQSADDPVVSDDYFGMINTLGYPEIAIGRYPVSKLSELDVMLNNLYSYVKEPLPGLWRNSIVSLADDYRNGNSVNEVVHTRDLEILSQHISPVVQNEKIFAEEWDYDQFLNKPKVRDELIRQINLGKLLFYYIGHGSFNSLGAEDFLSVATDLHRFKNSRQLSFFVVASCEVSQFEHWAFESLGQKSVLLEDRGMIASMAAASKSFPDPNHRLMMNFIPAILDRHASVGENLSYAKMRHTQSNLNDERYILFGDPNLIVTPPERHNEIKLPEAQDSSSYHARQIVNLTGDFPSAALGETARLNVYDTGTSYTIKTQIISKAGNRFFSAPVSVDNSSFEASFLVPDDINAGEKGLISAYYWDETQKKDYLAYYHPLKLSDEILPESLANDGPPQIELYLDSMDFRGGDTVGQSPTLYAKISDANGINITGKQGHDILLVLDNSLQPIPVTEYFDYDLDSYTQGTLSYTLADLEPGAHSLQLIAFDNYNLPAVGKVNFISKKSSGLGLENLLTYPNPIKTDAYISFLLSDDASVSLDIFTMSGRRIRRIEQEARAGFHKIYFDGRDAKGKKLANNTYFIRVRAKNAAGKSVEKRERIVIYR